MALGDFITRSLAEVRLQHDIRARTQFGIAEFIAELAPAAALDASARGLSFDVEAGHAGVNVDADRSILAATVVNLLQNAFKFTRPGTTVTLRSSATPDRVRIEVEDECGGLPDGNVDALFQPFEQRGADRRVGSRPHDQPLGRRGQQWSNQRARLPGHGCIFIIDLPRAASCRRPRASTRMSHEPGDEAGVAGRRFV